VDVEMVVKNCLEVERLVVSMILIVEVEATERVEVEELTGTWLELERCDPLAIIELNPPSGGDSLGLRDIKELG
jgi:hypothetical protein